MELTYRQIWEAVLGRRFPGESNQGNAKRWVDSAYADVWSAVDWTFRRVPMADFAVTSSTPVMPTDFADAIDLYSPEGVKLTRLSEEDFECYYLPGLATASGPADAYAVTNRQIYLSSSTSGIYKLSYYRRLGHRRASLEDYVAGSMTEDTDRPLWNDHHSLLIPRAQAIGLIEINDPSWQPLQEEYERQLSRMKKDYEQVRPAKQWGSVYA